MGIGNLEKMKPTEETPTGILELVRTSVTENLQSDFYHNADEHIKSTIELHKEISKKYPNFYSDVFNDKEFMDYFLDASKILSMPFLLQDKENIDIVLKNLSSIQINRIEDPYNICKLEELFGVKVSNKILQEIFERQSKDIENTKNKNYVGFIAVKYANSLHNLLASTRIKREKLTPAWKEAVKWVFDKDENFDYTLPALKEVALLRKLTKEKGPLGSFKPKYIPWTVWRGYADNFNIGKKTIYRLGYPLMSGNEVKRNLNKLQEFGILEKKSDREKIEKKVMKAEFDLINLLYSLKVLDKKAKEILLRRGKEEHKRVTEGLEPTLKDKDIAIAMDCSSGCSGHSNLLDRDIQKKILKGEEIPRWATLVLRDSFNANVLIGKILSDSANSSISYLFNESIVKVDLPSTLDELIEELKKVECSGGSDILGALKKAIETNPDIVFVVTDLNENIPFQGALKLQLEKISKEFKGSIIFILTETIIERPESVLLDDLIREKKLTNIFLIPVKQLRHLEKGFVLINLLEKAKKIYVRTQRKKKVKKNE